MKRSRLITAGIVLLGALTSCIGSLIQKVTLATFIKRLAITVVIFIVIAFIIEIIIDWNFKPEEEEKEDSEGAEGEESSIENVDTDVTENIVDSDRQ